MNSAVSAASSMVVFNPFIVCPRLLTSMWGKLPSASMIRVQSFQMSSRRPAHVKPPAHLSKSPPVPEPEPLDVVRKDEDPLGKNPTRYGDWELKGIAVDF